MSLKPTAAGPAVVANVPRAFAANDPDAGLQPVGFSFGRDTYDNKPKQRDVGSFAEFRDAVLATQCKTKGKTFVCAPFAEGVHDDPANGSAHWRCARLAQPRRWLPFDLDAIRDRAAFDALMHACERWSGLAYETASSTGDAPRCRIILELDRPVTRDEGMRLGPELAALLTRGLDSAAYTFDASVYRAEQPCYTPTKDAPRRAFDGGAVNVDVVLSTVTDEPEEPAIEETDGKLPGDIPGALSHIAPDERDTWLQVGMALHSTGDPDAFFTWWHWSEKSDKFDEDDQRKTWESFRDKSGGVTLGTLYQLAKDGGWVRPQRTAPKSARTASPAYKLLTGTDVQALPALAWRIKGVLPARGLAQVYGPPASGKSFLAFDMGAAIAGGHDWFGYRVKQAPVVYVVLEGAAGAKQRTQAWCRTRGEPLPDDMRLILQPLRIADAGDVDALAKAITDAELAGAVVIVDTQNMAAPDADENSSADVGRILQGAKRLSDLVEGVVILVAHSGKDEGRGVRGHSSQRAAMDASIKVTRDGDAREWAVDKSKDGTDSGRHGFTLEVVRLGEDADGDAVTSCVVVRDDSAKPRRKLSAGEQLGLKSYITACERGLCRGDGAFAGLHLEDWRSAYYELSTADNDTTKRQAFHRARRDMCAHGHMTVDCDVYMAADVSVTSRGQEFLNIRSQYRKGQTINRDKRDTP